MKVMQHGKNGDLKRWSRELVCEEVTANGDGCGCGALLKITAPDLILACDAGRHSGRRYYAAVRCPDCCARVEVRELPKPLWDALCEDDALLNPWLNSDF